MWKIVQVAATLTTAFFTIIPGMMALAPEFGWASNAPIRWLIDNSFWITAASAMLFGGLIEWQLKEWVLKRNGVTPEHIAQLEAGNAALEEELRRYTEPPITVESIDALSDGSKAVLETAYSSNEAIDPTDYFGLCDEAISPLERDGLLEPAGTRGLRSTWMATRRAIWFLDEHPKVVEHLRDISTSVANDALQAAEAKEAAKRESKLDVMADEFRHLSHPSQNLIFNVYTYGERISDDEPRRVDKSFEGILDFETIGHERVRWVLDASWRELFDDRPELFDAIRADKATRARDDVIENPDRHLGRLPFEELRVLQMFAGGGMRVPDARELPEAFWNLHDKGLVWAATQEPGITVLELAPAWSNYIEAFPDALATEIARAEADRARHEEC